MDTNILVRAYIDFEPDYLEVTTLAVKKFQLCLDFGNIIDKEYRSNLDRSLGFQKWYKRLKDKNGVYLCDGKLPKKHRSRLAGLGCHEPSDHVFIGVAFHTDRVLLSEDSDVGKGTRGGESPHPAALRYLTENMHIRVFDAGEARDFLQR